MICGTQRQPASTTLAFEPHVIEAALNHVNSSRAEVHRIYNRSPYEREVRNALVLGVKHVLKIIAQK